MITSGSFLAVIIFTSLFITLIWLFARNTQLIIQTGIKLLIGCVVIILARMFFPFEISFADSIAIPAILPFISKFLSTPVGSLFDHTIHYSDLILFCWISGIIIKTIYSTHTYMSFKKSIDNMVDISNSQIRYILPDSIKVIKTNWVSTPMIFGLLHPNIIIPNIEFTQNEWMYILQHEITHYRNHDMWVKFIIELLCIIYWWNPFVYILRKQIFRILEVRTDIKVAKSFSDDEINEYVYCLLKIAKTRAATNVNKFALQFTRKSESALSQRSYVLLNHHHKASVRYKYAIALVLIVAVLMYASFAFAFEPYSIDEETERTTFELTFKTSFLIINDDGGYDVYSDNQYVGTVIELNDAISELPIYENIEESKKQ